MLASFLIFSLIVLARRYPIIKVLPWIIVFLLMPINSAKTQFTLRGIGAGWRHKPANYNQQLHKVISGLHHNIVGYSISECRTGSRDCQNCPLTFYRAN